MSDSPATKSGKVTVGDLITMLGQYDKSLRVVVRGFDEYGFSNAAITETTIGPEEDGSFADFGDGDVERAVLIN